MRIGVYKTSGGKDIVLGTNYSPEGLAKILTILQILQDEGLDRLVVRTVDKNSKPKLLEIKRDGVRVFYFQQDGNVYITHIVENKQKNKTEANDKKLAVDRIKRMLDDTERHVAWV